MDTSFKDFQIMQYNFGEVKRWEFFGHKIYAKILVCTICLEDFMEGEEIVLCPCKHCFHQHCIKDWLRMKNSCPVCKLLIQRSFLATELTPLLHVVWGFMKKLNKCFQIFSIIASFHMKNLNVVKKQILLLGTAMFW